MAERAHEVASKMSDRVAAFASVSGCLNGTEKRPDKAVPALLIHGTNDSLVPFNGRRFTPLMPRMLPFSAARDFWKSSNGTNESTQTEVKPGVIKETHVNKKSGNEVVVYTLKGNGHGWPGRPDSIDGKPCLKVKGEDLIWDFFSKHKKAG